MLNEDDYLGIPDCVELPKQKNTNKQTKKQPGSGVTVAHIP